MERQKKSKGVVIKYVKERGFGFVECGTECGTKSIFFHVHEVWEEQRPLLSPGVILEFDLAYGKHAGNCSQKAAVNIEVITETPTTEETTASAVTETAAATTTLGSHTSYACVTRKGGSLTPCESAVKIYNSMKATLSEEAELQETATQLKGLLSTGLKMEIEANLKVQLKKTEGKLKQIPAFSEREETLLRFLEVFCEPDCGDQGGPEKPAEGEEGEEGGAADTEE